MAFSTQGAVNLLLFVSGFTILSLEMVGIRILAPYTGITVPVWAALLSVALLGSAVGYWVGGVLADRTQKTEMLLWIACAASLLIALIPLSRFALPLMVGFVPYAVSAFFASLFLFFLPITCLGALTTYSIRISLRTVDTIAEVHGDLYALATIGSVVGVFGTSYFLIPSYTLPTILYAMSAMVFLTGLCSVLPTKAHHLGSELM